MNRTTAITSVITFAVGLLTGALVFSQPAPSPAAVAMPSVAESPDAVPAAAPESTVAAIRSVASDAESSNADQPAPEVAEPEVRILLARIDDISQGWGRMQAELAALRQRIGTLEQRQVETPAETNATANRPSRPTTPDEQRTALLRAGVTAEVADDLVWRRAQLSLDRLDLRDQAIREGWLNSDRYREEMRKINEQRVSVRDEIGVDAYDRYLFETGQDNRVLVDSVIPGSAGEDSGMLPGDVIERYGDQPIYDFGDLRGATSDGARDELVPVTVRRGNQLVELLLPRGPIGIGLDATRIDPSP
ncbi:MAG: PDZ domain-containing protein [Thiohalocapsa sp.]